jgi:serine phosphatase RsbU (regulator of sigma subunit)
MKIGIRLTISFLVITFISMLVVGMISYNKAKKSLEQESFNRLTAVREMKASQIEDYFHQITDQLLTFSEDPTVVEAMKQFEKGYKNIDAELGVYGAQMKTIDGELDSYLTKEYLPRLNKNSRTPVQLETEVSREKNARILQHLYIVKNPNPVGEKHKMDVAEENTTYGKAHKLYHHIIRHYLEKFGYYDIFLVDETGNIVYTVFKEVDFGTSLIDGPFKETNLAYSFRSVRSSTKKDYIKLADFRPYHPSYNAPASFIATPIYDGDQKIGSLVFQMPIDRINDIMTNKREWSKVGLGKSGETYIVGEDFTLRNQSRFLLEDSTNYFKMIEKIGIPKNKIEQIRNFKSGIGLQEVKTEGTEEALRGETNTKIFPDYRGVSVLSAYKPLNIAGMNWAIMSEIDEEEAFEPVMSLRKYVIYAFLVLFVIVIGISVIISRQITKPLKELTHDAMELAKGNLDVEIGIRRKDEIGILSLSFRKMQISIRNLIGELRNINQNLENKVAERTMELQTQKEMVEHKNKEIVDSINYAKRLQTAILPPMDKVKQHLQKSFVLFKPKDIVSGDFYWMHYEGNELLVAAVDCTGHGVPGAMVSVVGSNALDRCVKEFKLKKPSEIMDKMSQLVQETFETSNNDVKDGMDMTLISLNLRTNKMQFAGANNPLWIVREGADKVEEIKADKQPIGQFEFRKPFTNHIFEMKEGDCVYLLSDGYADQFGGPDGKKFKYKTLRDHMLAIHAAPMEEQVKILEYEFEKWKGNHEQIDDVCIIGIKI